MKNVKLFSVLKTRKYGTIAILAAIAMTLIYPYTKVALTGGLYNYFFWFEMMSKTSASSVLNLFLYVMFSAIFGIVVSLGVHNWHNKTCSLKGSAGSGSFGSLIAISTTSCPGCLSLASLVLPATATASLALPLYSTLLNIASVALLLVSIHLMGGFKPQ